MNAARRPQINLAALIGEELSASADAPPEEHGASPEDHGVPPGGGQPEPARSPAVSSRAPRPRRPASGTRRSAADLVGAPRTAPVARKPLNVDVPVELDLHTRSHMYRLREGIDIRDQVALALDAWLKERGY